MFDDFFMCTNYESALNSFSSEGTTSPIEEETNAALIRMDKLPSLVQPVNYWGRTMLGIYDSLRHEIWGMVSSVGSLQHM